MRGTGQWRIGLGPVISGPCWERHSENASGGETMIHCLLWMNPWIIELILSESQFSRDPWSTEDRGSQQYAADCCPMRISTKLES